MKIAVTGHRPPKGGLNWESNNDTSFLLAHKFMTVIKEVSKGKEVEEGISGMALGADIIFAQVCFHLNIPLTAAIPCKNQEKKWSVKCQNTYKAVLSRARKIHYVSNDEYTPRCMNDRNMWMVDQLTGEDDVLISFWDGTSGGTKNCIDYAKSKNKTIIQINPKQL